MAKNAFKIEYAVDLEKQTLKLIFIQGEKRCEADIDCKNIYIDYLAEDFATMDMDNDYGIVGTRYLPECSGNDLVLSIAYTYGHTFDNEPQTYHVDISSRHWKRGKAQFTERGCFYDESWEPITKEFARVFKEIAGKYPALGRPLKEFKEEQEREQEEKMADILAYITSGKEEKN